MDYIAELPISPEQKHDLIDYYNKVWSLVDSGEINLELDLHFEVAGEKINVDLKSGFGSNEKGNTNRLLIVATIYKNLHAGYRSVLLVRAPEDQNKSLLQNAAGLRGLGSLLRQRRLREDSGVHGFRPALMGIGQY